MPKTLFGNAPMPILDAWAIKCLSRASDLNRKETGLKGGKS